MTFNLNRYNYHPLKAQRWRNCFRSRWSFSESTTQTISTASVDSFVDFFSLFFDVKETADVVINVNSSTSVYAHRLVLGCYSRRFWKMLLKEEEKSSLQVVTSSTWFGADVFDPIHIRFVEDDECADVFPEFIEFLYTERIALDLKSVWPLIRLGKKYDVHDLVLTCTSFIRKKISSMPFGIPLVQIIQKAKSEKTTVGIVQYVMQRLCKELFSGPVYATMLLRMDVNILCDVLRSNDVIVKSEYDVFKRLKPILETLKAAGEDRQVLRLLSLLRLTHLTPSQLRELHCSEYMAMIRKAFPGYFERALWIRAYKADEFKEEFPIKIETRREETRDIKIRGRCIPRHARDYFDPNVQHKGYAIFAGYLWDFDQVLQ